MYADHVLPDYLRAGLGVVFAGTSVSTTSAARGHYYSNPTNKFWSLLGATGLLGDIVLGPEDDVRINDFRIGLTDIVKARAESSDSRLETADFDVASFVAKVEDHRPLVIAFNGGLAAKAVARHLGRSVPSAAADWQIAGAQVYRLPSSSGAAAIGTDTKVQAWQAFGAWLRADIVVAG
jgi:TDG/mug DNA glycosylase family protein